LKGEFKIYKISSHNAFLYNRATNKYVKESVHINRIKPCYQRDNVPEDDKVIGDIPIVEVTYPNINAMPTTSATGQQINETQNLVQRTQNMNGQIRSGNTQHKFTIANSGTTLERPKIH